MLRICEDAFYTVFDYELAVATQRSLSFSKSHFDHARPMTRYGGRRHPQVRWQAAAYLGRGPQSSPSCDIPN